MKKYCLAIVAVIFMLVCSLSFAATLTGNDWVGLRNAQKVSEVKAYIKGLRSQGVTVKGDPIAYCKKLDNLYVRHPNVKKEEVGKTLKTIMIMEYDWEEKGIDKDTVAKSWLGEELYNKNKARRGK